MAETKTTATEIARLTRELEEARERERALTADLREAAGLLVRFAELQSDIARIKGLAAESTGWLSAPSRASEARALEELGEPEAQP